MGTGQGDDRTQGGLQMQAIVAMTPSRVIGRVNKLPWHLPEDLKQFKERTTGHAILMGRKTFDSIGKPLPHRRNIVLSRQEIDIPGTEVIQDLAHLHKMEINGDLYVIGGAEVYRQTLPHCRGLYLTTLRMEYEGDVFFPPFRDRFEHQADLFENEDFTVSYLKNLEALPVT